MDAARFGPSTMAMADCIRHKISSRQKILSIYQHHGRIVKVFQLMPKEKRTSLGSAFSSLQFRCSWLGLAVAL